MRQSLPGEGGAVADVLRQSILKLCQADHGGDPETQRRWLANKTADSVEEWISAGDSYCVTALSDAGSVIGFGLLRREGEILLLYVHPAYVGHGAGHDMLAALEQRAREWGLTEISLDSTRTAAEFYRRHGYMRAGSCRERDDGLACLAMRKRLAS